MQKKQLLSKTVRFLRNNLSIGLPVDLLSIYNNDNLIRIFLFRISQAEIVAEILNIN